MTEPQAASYWLDRVTKQEGLTSDYQLARRLHVSRAAINQQRGKGSMSAETAIKIGWLLGMNPLAILASSSAAREVKPETVDFWLEVLRVYSDETHLGLLG